MTKNKPTVYKYLPHLFVLAVILAFLIISFGMYRLSTIGKVKDDPFPNHTFPYVDGEAAAEQVKIFYEAYTSSKPILALNKKQTVKNYGTNNLEFYYEYYQHGFDSVVCSTVMPTSITAVPASTGTVANVDVNVDYPDGSTARIKTTVILNDDGMQVDSINCPGDKGNLPPK